MNLLKDDIPKLVKDIALPASTGMIFSTLYNVSALFFAGMISSSAVAGISVCFFLYFLIIAVGFGFGAAITAIIGNCLGDRKVQRAKIYAHKGLVFMMLFGCFMAVVGFLSAPFIIRVLGGIEGGFYHLALSYIQIIFLSAPFFLATNALNGILMSLGDSKTYRNWLIVGLLINITLSYLFVKGYLFLPPLRMEGIALATAIAQICGVFYLLLKVKKSGMLTFVSLKRYLPNYQIYRHIIAQGIPSCLNYSSIAIGSFITMYFVSTYGVEALAGTGVGLRIEQMILLPALGISSATLAIVSRNYGAKNFQRVKFTLQYVLKIMMIYCFFAGLLCIFFGPKLIAFFDKSLPVIEYGSIYLYVDSLGFIGYATMFVCAAFLQAVKKPMMIFILNFLRQVVFLLISFYLIVTVFGLEIVYMWFGVLFTVYLVTSIFLIYSFYLLKKEA